MKPCKLCLGRGEVICLAAAGNVPVDAPCPWCRGLAFLPDWSIGQPSLDEVGGEWFEVVIEGVTFHHRRASEWHADVGPVRYALRPNEHGYGVTATNTESDDPGEALIASAEDGEAPTLLHAVAWVLGRVGPRGRQ